MLNTFPLQNQLFFAGINLDFSFRNIFQKLKLLIRKCCITFEWRHYRLFPFNFRNFKSNRIFFIIIKCGGGPHEWLHELKKEISFPWKKKSKFLTLLPKVAQDQCRCTCQIWKFEILNQKSKIWAICSIFQRVLNYYNYYGCKQKLIEAFIKSF